MIERGKYAVGITIGRYGVHVFNKGWIKYSDTFIQIRIVRRMIWISRNGRFSTKLNRW